MSVRILGVWINQDFKKTFILNQAKSIIKKACKLMNFKRLTEHQILYIYNRVISSQIEYKIQLTIFNKEEFLKISVPFRKLLKKRTHLVNTIPNYMLYTHQGYNIKSLYDT